MNDDIFEKPYWIIDILPEQVPADSKGQYFAVERYFLMPENITEIFRKQLGLMLKLNCYYDFYVSIDFGEHWEKNVIPEKLSEMITMYDQIYVRIDDSLLVAQRNDTYLTMYDPDERLIDLTKQIASAEGLFVWQAHIT